MQFVNSLLHSWTFSRTVSCGEAPISRHLSSRHASISAVLQLSDQWPALAGMSMDSIDAAVLRAVFDLLANHYPERCVCTLIDAKQAATCCVALASARPSACSCGRRTTLSCKLGACAKLAGVAVTWHPCKPGARLQLVSSACAPLCWRGPASLCIRFAAMCACTATHHRLMACLHPQPTRVCTLKSCTSHATMRVLEAQRAAPTVTASACTQLAHSALTLPWAPGQAGWASCGC